MQIMRERACETGFFRRRRNGAGRVIRDALAGDDSERKIYKQNRKHQNPRL